MSVIRTAHESPVVAATAMAATPTTTASTFASVLFRLPLVASIPVPSESGQRERRSTKIGSATPMHLPRAMGDARN